MIQLTSVDLGCDMLSTTASGQCRGTLVPSTYSCIESHARRRTHYLQTHGKFFTAPLPAQAPRQQRFAHLKSPHSRTMATRASKPASDDISFLKQVALEAAKTGAKVRSRFVEHPVLSFQLPFSMLSLRLCMRHWRNHAISISKE